MIHELSEKEVLDKFGFNLHNLHDNISNGEFADDTGLFGNSRHSAIELYQQSTQSLSLIGLKMNPSKSVAISIVKGELCQDPLDIGNGQFISCIGPQDTIKYLGVTFNDCIVFDESKCAKKFADKIEKLTSSVMLRPDQKLKILKDYLWPTLVYPFQNAPLSKLSPSFLETVDKIMRSSVKEFLSIPTSTPTNMLYSSTKVKGVGLVRAKWEAGIQNFNSKEILLNSGHALIQEVKDLVTEKSHSLDFLNIPQEVRKNMIDFKGKKSKLIRDHLRSVEYDAWCKLPQKGQGVVQFQECSYANRLIHSKIGLSTSEWITTIKMVGNVLPVNAIPRPDQGSLYCRHGCKEIETIGHILGKCPRSELIRNNRHHAVRHLIAEAMQKLGWKTLEEAECTGNGSRRVDILAYNLKSKQGIILDPTIRMEQNDLNQAENVNEEKQRIYDPCIPYLQQKLGLDDIKVIGLYIGARGTITKFFQNFMKAQCLPSTLIEDIVVSVLKKSAQICVHHLYSCAPTD